MPNIPEQRQFSRTSVSFPVSIELPNRKRAKATAVNIGQGGMLVRGVSGVNFSRLDDVNIYLPIDEKQNSVYTIAAKVTRITGSEMGLFFYSDPSEFLQLIN